MIRRSRVFRAGTRCVAQAEKALVYYDRLLAAAESPDPVVQLDLARACREAATIQYVAGRFPDCIANLERSLSLLDAVAAERTRDREIVREQVLSRTKLGLLLWETQKDFKRALIELGRAVWDAESLVQFDPRSITARTDLAWCLHDLATVFLENHQIDQALAPLRRAIAINRELLAEQPADLRRREILAENLNNLGLLTLDANPELAEAAYGEAAKLLDLASSGQIDGRRLISLTSILNNWGNLASRLGRREEALGRFNRGLTLVENALKLEPGDIGLRYSALNLHGSRATCLERSAGTRNRSPIWTG